MTDRYQNKYRIASARHPAWDYGWNAAYFITICTKDRICYFGKIVETPIHGVSTQNAHVVDTRSENVEKRLIASLTHEPQMRPSEIGQIANQYWLEIPERFPFVRLGNHIIMPNHVHGIVIIEKPNDGRDSQINERNVETRLIASLLETKQPIGGITGNHNPMLHDNLSKIIRWYKGRMSFESRKIHTDFAWQSRFHDHIIRDDKSFHTISEYIIDNPLKWAEDKFYTA